MFCFSWGIVASLIVRSFVCKCGGVPSSLSGLSLISIGPRLLDSLCSARGIDSLVLVSDVIGSSPLPILLLH